MDFKHLVDNIDDNILFVLIGPAGSGKTRLRHLIHHVCANQGKFVTDISPDEIRWSTKFLDYDRTGIDFDPAIEPQIWQEVDIQLMDAFSVQKQFICMDATNLTVKRRMISVLYAKQYNYRIYYYVFDYPLRRILRQNAGRKRVLDDHIIARQYLEYEAPSPNEYDLLIKMSEME